MDTLSNSSKPGSLKTWLDYIEGLDPNKIDLGLDRVQAVLQRLNLDFLKKVPVVEVAGTNGKGSTAALIAASLSYSHISTGLYTSPHLIRFNERIAIDGQSVEDEVLCEAFSRVFDAAGTTPLTYFEYTTLAALVCFDIKKVEALVLEIGLGGRLDAVNAIDADISVITSIGLDHTRILGDTIEKIAFEKAGIIKKDRQVVVGRVDNAALAVIAKKAEEMTAKVFAEGIDFYGHFLGNGFDYVEKSGSSIMLCRYPLPKIPLCCAPAAIMAIKLLKEKGVKVGEDAIKRALNEVALPGRMQKVSDAPALYLDVAHNPPAAVNLVNTLNARKIEGKRLAVIGMLKDKDIESVLKIVSGSFDEFYVATLHTVRGENSSRLSSALISSGIGKDLIKSYEQVSMALNSALKKAAKNDEIVVLGSFVTVAEAMESLKK